MKNAPATLVPAVTERVLHALLRTLGLLRQVQEPYFAQFGISPSQWGILRALQRAGAKEDLSLKEISEQLLIQPPSVTGAVDRLERQGLVKRSLCTKDLRVRHLSLTPQGRALIERVLQGHAERVCALLAGLDLAEQETMLKLLQRLHAHLKGLELPPGAASRGNPK